MKLYAELPGPRTRQVGTDVLVLAWVILWVVVGVRVHDLVGGLAAPGARIQQAGGDFAAVVSGAGEDVADVPLVGEQLQAPFESVAGAGRLLRAAGRRQQEVVHTLALWLGILFALIPIVLVLSRWFPARIAWVREAHAAAGIRIDAPDLHLFALRAIATRPLAELRRAVPDPAGAYARGDYAALAALELEDLGLRTSALRGGPNEPRP